MDAVENPVYVIPRNNTSCFRTETLQRDTSARFYIIPITRLRNASDYITVLSRKWPNTFLSIQRINTVADELEKFSDAPDNELEDENIDNIVVAADNEEDINVDDN